MSIYHNGQKVAGYTSGRNSAILSNITLLPGEFKTQEDGTYMCTLDNTLVLDESIVDVYFASSSQKAGSKANIWVSSAAGKIYFHAKKVPTQGLIAETIRIVNPSQDDSYNSDQSAAITGLQQPVFEDYNGIYPATTDTNHTDVDTSKLPNYTETPENDEPLNYIIPSLGKVKSKNPLATILEGVKGALSWSAFLISNLKANVTKLQTDLTKLQTDLTSHISDYENIKYNYVNENDYAAYGWSETGITLTPRTWTPIPLSTTGGTNIEISDGKMKIKKRGTYLVNVFFHVKNTVNGTPYYDLGIFKNDIQWNNIIVNNSRGGGLGFITRYNFTCVIWLDVGDLLQPKVYSDLADALLFSSLDVIMLKNW